MFYMQSPSFLSHRRYLEQGHGHAGRTCTSLFGITAIPTDNQFANSLRLTCAP